MQKRFLLQVLLSICTCQLYAQADDFSIAVQLRPRAEFRNGFKTLQADSSNAAFFVEQRSRLSLKYKRDIVELKLSAQDIRTWGSTPLVNNSNGFFTLFEGWAKIRLAKSLQLKFGRQVFSYDNQRILGGLDWAAQGRAHDALMLEYKNDSIGLEIQGAAAYNNNAASLQQQPYTVTGNYQNMQFLRLHKKWSKLSASILAMNVGYAESISNLTVRYRQTLGGIFKFKEGGFNAQLEGYYQMGRDQANLPINAYLFAGQLSYKLKPFKLMLGLDYLSGTDQSLNPTTNNSFNPAFGTNHIFYGHLDYFYVGSAHGNVGLMNPYAQVSYTIPEGNTSFFLRYHHFRSTAMIFDPVSSLIPSTNLGHELDFWYVQKFKPYIVLKAGYAHLFGAESLEYLKPTGEVSNLNNWAWLMLNLNLEVFSWKKNAKNMKITTWM